MKTIPVAVRLTPEQLAKARDVLLAKGIEPTDLLTKSSILRLSVFFTIVAADNPDALPSEDSLSITE